MATSDHPQDAVPEDDGLSTSDVCKKLGLTRSKLRHWEQIGCVQPSRIRCGSRQWRRYGAEQVDLLRRITFLIKEGMTIRGAMGKAGKLAQMEAKRGSPFTVTVPEPAMIPEVASAPAEVPPSTVVCDAASPKPVADAGAPAVAENAAVQAPLEGGAGSGGQGAAGIAAEPEDDDWLK